MMTRRRGFAEGLGEAQSESQGKGEGLTEGQKESESEGEGLTQGQTGAGDTSPKVKTTKRGRRAPPGEDGSVISVEDGLWWYFSAETEDVVQKFHHKKVVPRVQEGPEGCSG